MERSADEDFDEMFVRVLAPAKRLAFRVVGDDSVAEELAAEALTRAYVRWRRLRSSGHGDAWVMRVTANLALDVVRRRPAPAPAPREPADPADTAALRLALVHALGQLPAKQRDAVVLRYLADYREDEVATALGVASGTVKSHLHRALASLRTQLGNDPVQELAPHV
ncbi:MAG: sigma-70 family RNA polymerase sigma factor [Acidimicrobiia bacterium]